MNPVERESLRESLIRFLGSNPADSGTAEGLLVQLARAEGRAGLAFAEVRAELVYLEDKGLVKQPIRLLSPENRWWRLTAEGRDFAAERGLA